MHERDCKCLILRRTLSYLTVFHAIKEVDTESDSHPDNES